MEYGNIRLSKIIQMKINTLGNDFFMILILYHILKTTLNGKTLNRR